MASHFSPFDKQIAEKHLFKKVGDFSRIK